MESFRELENEEGNALTHNFRPVQPLGDRIVLFNEKNAEAKPTPNDIQDNNDNKLDGSKYDIVGTKPTEIPTSAPKKKSKNAAQRIYMINFTHIIAFIVLSLMVVLEF